MLLFAFLIGIGTAWPSPQGHAPRLLLLSFSVPALRPNERIVGLTVELTSARIASLSCAPAGWHLSIDNDPSWKTKLEGMVAVGAAAMEGRSFQDVLTIERLDDPKMPPFGVRVAVNVTADFEKSRVINIDDKTLTLRTTATVPARPCR
jgi:hypothetical protein